MGDLNICLLKNNFRGYRLRATIEGVNLEVLPFFLHVFSVCKPSLLDAMIISSPTHVCKHDVYIFLPNS